MPDAEIANFWLWFRKKSSALQRKPSDKVRDALHAALIGIHPLLAVEVAASDKGQTAREVIVSGSGDPIVMQRARDIVAAAPLDKAWRFVALKPARGFDFVYADDCLEIEASRLHFSSLTSSKKPGALGLLIYCPDRFTRVANIVEAMWRIVEIGIGEEAAAGIAVIQVASDGERPESAIPLGDLGDFLDWHRRRGNGPSATPH